MNNHGLELSGIMLYILGIGTLLLFLYAAIISYKEREPNAANRFLIMGILISLIYLMAGYYFGEQRLIVYALFAIPSILVLVYFLPIRFHGRFQNSIASGRIDERNTMFSRNELVEGTDNFISYYEKNPKLKVVDDGWRMNPGLLNPGSGNYNPAMFMASHASFYTVAALKPFVDSNVSSNKLKFEKEDITNFVKNWAIKLGAVDVGITELKDYHSYSYRGRKGTYNDKVELNHKYAIAFTVEMNIDSVNSGPLAPIVMESAQQYLDSGTIAVQIAEFLRSMGYPARAHIDGNYQVVCPLVAKDAGLGDIGRMGLLMTPKLGPRVRIGVVTTDMPFITDKDCYDPSMIEFCTNCKKCAVNCPSDSISYTDREEINGVMRWQINQETCFDLWTKSGTDCGRCMSVCPYSHPDNPLHNVVRFGIKNSSVFSRIALKLDDVIYGKKPTVKPPLKWMNIKPTGN